MSSYVMRVISRKGAISRTFCNSSSVKVETWEYECLCTEEEISNFSSTKGEGSLRIDWLEGEAIWLLSSLEHCMISPSYSVKFWNDSNPAWTWKTSLTESTEDWKYNSGLDFLKLKQEDQKFALFQAYVPDL